VEEDDLSEVLVEVLSDDDELQVSGKFLYIILD
jgi:hypothetical protein